MFEKNFKVLYMHVRYLFSVTRVSHYDVNKIIKITHVNRTCVCVFEMRFVWTVIVWFKLWAIRKIYRFYNERIFFFFDPKNTILGESKSLRNNDFWQNCICFFCCRVIPNCRDSQFLVKRVVFSSYQTWWHF